MRGEKKKRWPFYFRSKRRGSVVIRLAMVCIPVLLWVWAGEAGAIIAIRPDLEVEGYVQAQTILRTPNFA
ncbi:MAG: hypothetical protein AB7G75_30070, partial [Candidatus Binatia bacterium]